MYNLYIVALYTPVGTLGPTTDQFEASPKWAFYDLLEATTFAVAMLAPWRALIDEPSLTGNDRPWAWFYGEDDDGEHTLLTRIEA